MTAIALHHHAAAAATVPGLRTNDSQSDESTGSSTEAATISANDFLTLLVTEMKNQDPTANTDPNEYINQLVNVNSLEQLISINQTLSGALDPAQGSSASGEGRSRAGASRAELASGALPSAAAHVGIHPTSHVVEGNLGVPTTSVSVQRISKSLAGEHEPTGPYQISAS
jgi:flagellar basal-body rod modification protein FlgD